jgi:hypothetical protein
MFYRDFSYPGPPTQSASGQARPTRIPDLESIRRLLDTDTTWMTGKQRQAHLARIDQHLHQLDAERLRLLAVEHPALRRGERQGQRPWFLTASMAAAAASGSKYSPPLVTGRKLSSSS